MDRESTSGCERREATACWASWREEFSMGQIGKEHREVEFVPLTSEPVSEPAQETEPARHKEPARHTEPAPTSVVPDAR